MNRKLFIGVGVLTAIAIVVMAVFALRAKDENTANTNQVQNASLSVGEYLEIPEFDLRFKRAPGTADVSYVVRTVESKGGPEVKYVSFTSTEVNALVNERGDADAKQYCLDPESLTLGVLAIRSTYPDGDEGYLSDAAKVLPSGDYIEFRSGQNVCTDDTVIMDFIGEKVGKIVEGINSLETLNGKQLPLVQQGTLKGSLGYPSEGIPDGMSVCVVATTGQQSYCQSGIFLDKEFTYGKGFIINVPVGKYKVYATLAEDPRKAKESERAYWSKYVQCGMKVGCTDHTPIVVTVKSGDSLTGIDPQDWYSQN